MTGNDELVATLSRDYRHAALDPAERAMIDFAAKLTRTPQRMMETDVAVLREHDFDDLAIHDIVVVAAYYAFVNRIADGLGVDLEPGWEKDQ